MASRVAPGDKCPRCLKPTGRPITPVTAAVPLVYYQCDDCPHVWIEQRSKADRAAGTKPVQVN